MEIHLEKDGEDQFVAGEIQLLPFTACYTGSAWVYIGYALNEIKSRSN
jgi:hypothetical protein